MIANEIMDAFARGFPGSSEGQILLAIIRKTYGWHKKEDDISISQIEDMTGISRRMVIYSLQNLEAKRMITIRRKRGAGVKNVINTIAFQKNYEIWVVQEKSDKYKKTIEKQKLAYKKSKELVVQEKVSSARKGHLVVQEIGKKGVFLAPTKETSTKETSTKETKESTPLPPKGGGGLNSFPDPPTFISPEVWKCFFEHRKAIKAPLTPFACTLIFKKLEKWKEEKGWNPDEILQQSVENGWKGIFELKSNGKVMVANADSNRYKPAKNLWKEWEGENGERKT